ncbi:hypothetical protein AAVH_32073, partial [Aphelenchoides avenae]
TFASRHHPSVCAVWYSVQTAFCANTPVHLITCRTRTSSASPVSTARTRTTRNARTSSRCSTLRTSTIPASAPPLSSSCRPTLLDCMIPLSAASKWNSRKVVRMHHSQYTTGTVLSEILLAISEFSPRVELHIDTYVFIEVLRFLPRSELEKMLLVSRRWSSIIGRATASLQQRRCFFMDIKFYGESPGMLSVHFSRSIRQAEYRILRVLTTRGVSQALDAVRLHMRNAFVKGVDPDCQDLVPPPSPPREMLVDISRQGRIDWLKTLLRSMPPNSEIGSWGASDDCIGSDNLLTLASCALEPHRKLGCVQELELGLFEDDATWAQLADLLNQPTIRAFSEIAVWTTRVAINPSKLRAVLSSWQSMKLHLYVSSGTKSRDSLLKLPTRIIRDFLALENVNRYVAEFSLHINEPDSIAFSEMPDIDEANGRRKRFRYHLQGEDTVVRVGVYENPTARSHLTVVTFDHFRLTVLFLNGNVSLAELKPILQRLHNFY